jgi:hypothetical protein
MNTMEYKKMFESIKKRAEKNKEVLEKIEDKSIVVLYELCDDLSYDVDFITKEWERDLYCKALFNAMIWGRSTK